MKLHGWWLANTLLVVVFAQHLSAWGTACTADEPQEQAGSSGRVNREDLRYAGRDFNQWQREFQTELMPAARIKAIEALIRFGTHGYAEEAAATIAEGLHDDDATVVAASAAALARIKPLARKWVNEVFVAWVEARRPADTGTIPTDNSDTPSAMRAAIVAMGDDAIGVLSDALGSKEDETRWAAITVLGELGPKASPAVDALVRVVEGDSESVSMWHRPGGEAIDVLARLGGDAKGSLPALLKVLRAQEGDAHGRAAAAVWEIAPSDDNVIAALKDALKRRTPGVEGALLLAIAPHERGRLTLSAKAIRNSATATSLLTEVLRPWAYGRPGEWLPDPRFCCTVIDVLGELGPGAQEAVSTLNKIVATRFDIVDEAGQRVDLAQHARDALRKIDLPTAEKP
jgi:hypothetical protein